MYVFPLPLAKLLLILHLKPLLKKSTYVPAALAAVIFATNLCVITLSSSLFCKKPPSQQIILIGGGLKNLLKVFEHLEQVSLPVILNEPLSSLQRLCEAMLTSEDLFNQAANEPDPMRRMTLAVIAQLSAY